MAFLLEILGAVALLLWGLRLVRTGVMRAYGPQLRKSARSAEGRMFSTLLSGCFIAVALQSSAATAMIVAGFSGQGIIGVFTALLAILGADIGTSLATIVVSQKIPYVPQLLMSAGVFGFLSTENPKWRSVSRALLGLGLILMALALIGATSSRLSTLPEFVETIGVLANFAPIMLLAGIALSYIAHSSLAMVLFSAGLASAGVIEPIATIYFVLGANIGSGLLPFLASSNSRKNARIPVTANLILKVAIVSIIYFAVPLFDLSLLDQIPGTLQAALIVHVLLNILVGIVGALAANFLIQRLDRILPHDPPDPNYLEPKHLDDSLVSLPTEALASAKREALVMAEVASDMVNTIPALFRDNAVSHYSDLEAKEDSVDRLFDAIKAYLASVMQNPLTETETRKAMDLLAFVTNIEHIGDVIDRNLIGLSRKKRELHAEFSSAGLEELERFQSSVADNFDLTIKVFLTEELDLAKQLFKAKSDIREMEQKSISTHVKRLGNELEESILSSELHLDILRDLRRINSHLASTAYPVMAAAGEVPKTKWKRRKA